MAYAQTFVSVNVGGRVLRVKPSSIHLISNENLLGLRWSSWGGPTAHGTGTDHSNGPAPGRSSSNAARVTLRDRRQCGSHLVYTTVAIHFTHGIPYAGEKRDIDYAYGCPS
jgi:hypothetical protein